MKAEWTASVCAAVLALSLGLAAPESSQNDQTPVLKTRPKDAQTAPEAPQTPPGAATPTIGKSGSPVSVAGPSAIPDGTRFIIKLKDTLDTSKMEQNKHFKAELR